MSSVTPTLHQGEWSLHRCRCYLPSTETDEGQRFKRNNTVSSGSTAKSWSCHSTTPSFSSTSTSILIETLQMHVSHASLPLLLHLAHLYWLCLFHALFLNLAGFWQWLKFTTPSISDHSVFHSPTQSSTCFVCICTVDLHYQAPNLILWSQGQHCESRVT